MFFCFAMANSLTWIYLAAISFAISMTLILPYMWRRMSDLAPRCWITVALVMVNVAAYAGQWLASPFRNFVLGITGDGYPLYLTYSVVFIVFMAVSIFNIITDKKRNIKTSR